MPIQNNQMPRITGHGFDTVPGPELQRSVFDRSHEHKGTMLNCGYLIPIMWDEVYPGDHFNCQITSFMRLATGLTPFMDNLYLDIHCWYVRTRLIWANFPKFLGEQINPGDSIDYLVPTVTLPGGGVVNGDLGDNLGIPPGIAPGTNMPIALPFRAYNFIWNLAYRDQNLQNSVPQLDGDTSDAYSNYTLLRRGKRHDYFTGCLPWPQKGDAVTLPLSGYAKVGPYHSDGTPAVHTDTQQNAIYYNNSGGTMHPAYMNEGGGGSATAAVNFTADSGANDTVGGGAIRFPTLDTEWGSNSGRLYLGASLSTATEVTINSLRESFALQQFLEKDARGGTRQNEIVKNHFGVTVPDAYYRPEYIGGGSVALKTFVIPQTSGTGVSGTPQANLAAYSTASHVGVGFNHAFDEHGYVMVLVSVRQNYTYQQGMRREWWRQTRYDYYWPTFANLGEQAVLNREIYYAGNDTQDTTAFGYQERWAELRYFPSEITGQFRSSFAQTLDSWHLAQKFTSLPGLNSTFIVENPPVDRVVAVQSTSGFPNFLMDFAFNYKCTRPLPMFSVPGLHRM